MKFTKMHGCGNDYVYVDCIHENLTSDEMRNLSDTARKVSNRMSGIGSDGLILIKPSTVADFCMEIYNADGTMAEMCGNGIRCVGKYVYDYGLTNQTQLRIETKSGIKDLTLSLKNGLVNTVRVDMGSPVFRPDRIPTAYIGELNRLFDYPIQTDLGTILITCVSMGNPHAVIFVEDVTNLQVGLLGRLIESHPLFPRKTNVEFVQIIHPNQIKMRVWERGSGETLACGTGACASVVASVLHEYTNHTVTVSLPGGELTIEYDTANGTVYMTGPAVTVFDGVTV